MSVTSDGATAGPQSRAGGGGRDAVCGTEEDRDEEEGEGEKTAGPAETDLRC